jgi:hypothetical protein
MKLRQKRIYKRSTVSIHIIHAGSAYFLGTSFFRTSSKFLYNSWAISTSSPCSALLFPNAYFFSRSCLNTLKNSSISLSYFASRYSLAGSFFVIGLNVFIFINSSLNMFTISFIDTIALRKYVPCLCFISSVNIINSFTAVSGVTA